MDKKHTYITWDMKTLSLVNQYLPAAWMVGSPWYRGDVANRTRRRLFAGDGPCLFSGEAAIPKKARGVYSPVN